MNVYLEAVVFFRRLSKNLADKWYRAYAHTLNFVNSRFAISLVRAKNRCFLGSRIMTNNISYRVDWEDGADLDLIPPWNKAAKLIIKKISDS